VTTTATPAASIGKMVAASYSSPWLNSFDGAHWSPWPMVPTAKVTSGRCSDARHGAVGNRRAPVTATALLLTSVLLYMIRLAGTPR